MSVVPSSRRKSFIPQPSIPKLMCELTVVKPDGTVLAEDVVYIAVNGDAIELRSILGDVTTVHGRISEIDITNEKATVQG